jgi:hypothetical protein
MQRIYTRRWSHIYLAQDQTEEQLKEWRIKNGFIVPAAVEAAPLSDKDLKARRAIWEMWADQGMPISDPDALYYLTLKQVGEQLRRKEHVYSWTILNHARKLSGGLLPGGDLEKRINDWVEQFDEKRAARRLKNDVVPREVPPQERLKRRAAYAVRDAVKKAEFRTKYSLDLDVRILPTLPQNTPQFRASDYKSSRRGGSRTNIEVTVLSDWARTVGPERANMFGPRTLVLGMWQLPQRTHVHLAVQGERKYEIKVKTGYLARDRDGNPVLKED